MGSEDLTKKIKNFLSVNRNRKNSYNPCKLGEDLNGDGECDGSGYGCGDACGFTFTDKSGHSLNYCTTGGQNEAYGCGCKCGRGETNDSGHGGVSGRRNFEKSRIKSLNGKTVYYINDIPTVVTDVYNNIAKGFIINDDLSEELCYICKIKNIFSHGETVEKATIRASRKFIERDTFSEGIEAFFLTFDDFNKCSIELLYEWYNKFIRHMSKEDFASNYKIKFDGTLYSAKPILKKFTQLSHNNIVYSVIEAIEIYENIYNINISK